MRLFNLLIILIYFNHISFAQIAPNHISCDPNLERLGSILVNGYKKRGTRCEGIYNKEISNYYLEIRSFTSEYEDFDLKSTDTLYLKWENPKLGNELRIEAKSIVRKEYYQMDTQQFISNEMYSWPSILLFNLNYSKQMVGVTAKTSTEINGSKKDIYIPISINSSRSSSPSDNYEMIVYPGVELKKVFISIVAFNDDGKTDEGIVFNKSLNQGFYPAHNAITVPLQKPKERGLFKIELAVVLENGESSNKSIWFYNSID